MPILSPAAAPGLGNPVAEIIAWAVLLVVIAMLLMAVWRQFHIIGRRGQIADSLGLLPQWKFFALARVETREDNFDDYHLLARLADDNGDAGPWQSVFWSDDRQYFHSLWNPGLHAQAGIQIPMMNVVNSGDLAIAAAYQTSLSYLTLLRHCLDRVTPRDGGALQFAIVTSRARDERPVRARYLSAWHCA